MRLLLLPFLLLWPAWLDATETPLTPDEARAALQAARPPGREPGAWRSTVTRTTKTEEITETRYELREPGRPVLRRIETVRRPTKGSRPAKTSVVVTNAEGVWELLGGVALRRPELLAPADLAKLRAETAAKATADLRKLKDEGRLDDPAARAALLAKFATHSGVRYAEADGAPRLRVRLAFGPEAQKLMRQLADEAWKQQKKRMSLAMRLVASPIYAAKRDDFLPVAQETVIDGTSGAVLSQTMFAKDGKPIVNQRRPPPDWKPAAPFAPDFFAVPAGCRRIEAKSLPEYEELRKKYRAGGSDEIVAPADEPPEPDEPAP